MIPFLALSLQFLYSRQSHLLKSVPTLWNHSPVLDRVDVEVDKPIERILVHWIYVGQISDAEEQDGGVLGDVSVTLSRLCNLFLCLFCDL